MRKAWYKFNTMPGSHHPVQPLAAAPAAAPEPFIWPARTWPIIHFAGPMTQRERGFATHWFAPSHALHLHNYRGKIRIDGYEYDLQPGDLTIIPRDSVASYDVPRPGESWCLHFDRVENPRGDWFALPCHMRLGTARQMAEARLREIHKMLAGRQTFGLGVAAAGAATQELLLWMGMRLAESVAPEAETPTERAVQEAAAWLVRNLDRPVSIPELARQVGLSQNYLARHFRQKFGMTMPHYLLQRRMEHAAWLLTHTDMAVKEIAARVGMPDLQHFNKAYRTRYGHSPTAGRVRMINYKI